MSDLHIVELALENGMKVVAEIDSASGRLTQSKGIAGIDGRSMEFTTTYEDFRTTDGHLIAFRENHYAMGNHVGYTQIEAIEFKETLPAAIFQMGN